MTETAAAESAKSPNLLTLTESTSSVVQSGSSVTTLCHATELGRRKRCQPGAAEEDSLTWRVQIGQFAGAGVLWSPPGRCATRFLWLQVLCFFLTAVLVYRTSHFSPCGPSPFSLSARNRRSHPLPPFTFDVTT